MLKLWTTRFLLCLRTYVYPLTALLFAVFTWNTTQSRLDAMELSTLAFNRAFPSHDHGSGLSKGEVKAFAASLQA